MTTGVEFDMHLIELVRANPSLYERDLRSSPYKSIGKGKTELWSSIATSLKVDVNICITRWKKLCEKLRQELLKEQPGGVGSNWTLLPKLQFMQQNQGYHNKERQQQQQAHTPTASQLQNMNITTSYRSINPDQLIEEVHDEEDPLQEAMDEQQISQRSADSNMPHTLTIDSTSSARETTVDAPTPIASAELMKRIEALLGGLGQANRVKAEKRILAYLCKCNLRVLNDEQIDDIFI